MLREGWYYVAVFVVLMVMPLYLQREAQAPYYATVALLIINQFNPPIAGVSPHSGISSWLSAGFSPSLQRSWQVSA